MDYLETIYLNNAATSYPKPDGVMGAVTEALGSPPSDPGRSNARGEPLRRCREALAELCDVATPEQVVLTSSATLAINQVISGLLGRGEGLRVVATDLEHNSVLRPLFHLRKRGAITLELLAPETSGEISPAAVAASLNEGASLLCLTQASNVTGVVQPVGDIAGIAAERGVPLLVDAAQGAGAVELSHRKLPGRIFVALAGHKGLFGPQGTGALIVPDAELEQTLVGGTGIRSDLELHPPELPIRHEAGTPNVPGFAGLAAGLGFVLEQGVGELGRYRSELVTVLRSKLRASIPGLSLSPLPRDDGRAGIVSFTVAGRRPEEMGAMLAQGFGIVVRTGLHCAPRAHLSLGTIEEGTLRLSVAAFNESSHVEQAVDAIERVCRS